MKIGDLVLTSQGECGIIVKPWEGKCFSFDWWVDITFIVQGNRLKTRLMYKEGDLDKVDDISDFRGYKIIAIDGVWRFSDTLDYTIKTFSDRACGHCGQHNTKEGYDDCIGTLPDVSNACCGHGITLHAYVQFSNGSCIRGQSAIDFFESVSARKIKS